MKPVHFIAILSQIAAAFFISILYVYVHMAKSQDNVIIHLHPKNIAQAETQWMQQELTLSTHQMSTISCLNEQAAERIHRIITSGQSKESVEKLQQVITEKNTQLQK